MQGEEAQPHKNITRSRFKLRCTECARRRIGCDKEIPCKPCLERGFEDKCHREPLKHKDALRELKLKKENQKWKEQNQRLMEENKELRGTLLQLVRDKGLLLGDGAVRDSPSIPNSFIASSQAVPNSSSYLPKYWPNNVDSIANRTEHGQREEFFPVVRPSASSTLTGHNGIFLQPAGNAKDYDKEFRNLQEQFKELQGKFATLESKKADISGAPRFEEVERSVMKEERDNRGGKGDGWQLGRTDNYSHSDSEHQAVVTCSSNSGEIGSQYSLQDMDIQQTGDMSGHVPFGSLSVSALPDINYTSLQPGGDTNGPNDYRLALTYELPPVLFNSLSASALPDINYTSLQPGRDTNGSNDYRLALTYELPPVLFNSLSASALPDINYTSLQPGGDTDGSNVYPPTTTHPTSNGTRTPFPK